jgi:hypothetical protein
MNTLLRKQIGIGLLLLPFGVTGCGLKDALQDSKRTERALKSELGLDAKVGVNITNGHTSVAVRLPTAPAGDAAEAKRAISDVVTRACHLKVERVDVSF